MFLTLFTIPLFVLLWRHNADISALSPTLYFFPFPLFIVFIYNPWMPYIRAVHVYDAGYSQTQLKKLPILSKFAQKITTLIVSNEYEMITMLIFMISVAVIHFDWPNVLGAVPLLWSIFMAWFYLYQEVTTLKKDQSKVSFCPSFFCIYSFIFLTYDILYI